MSSETTVEEYPHYVHDEGCSAADYEIGTLKAEVKQLREAGNDLAHWLQIWIDDHPENTWCYSEAALAKWRAALA